MRIARFLNHATTSVAIFLVLVFLSIFSFAHVKADEVSFWGTSQNPQLTIEEDAYQLPQDAGEHCTNKNITYRYYFRERWNFGYFKDGVNEQCSIATQYGEVTDGNFLRFKNDTSAYHIDLRGAPVLVPGASAYFYTAGIGNGNEGLFAIDNPIGQFERLVATTSGQGIRYEHEYFTKAQTTTRALKNSATGAYVQVGEIDTSRSGEWLIANLGVGRLARIDPDTFEMLTFPGGYPRFSQFSSAQPDMAISNDGRYAAMSGGFSSSYVLKVYDLSTCKPDAANNVTLATGCDPKDITEFMKQQMPGFIAARHLQFSSDGTQLYFTADGDGWGAPKRVTLTAPGQERIGMSYLALGDSYASGEGDLSGADFYEPGTDGSAEYPSEKCHLSRRSYPYLLANQLAIGGTALFKSVACSGAVSEDVVDKSDKFTGHFEQFDFMDVELLRAVKNEAVNNFVPGREAQIQFVEKYKPEALTIGLGGNDIGFKDKLIDCIFSEIKNFGFSCAPSVTETAARASEGNQIRNLYFDLKDLYTSLHTASDQTKIYVVGYPNIVKTNTACGLNVFLDDNEREYAIETVKYLNTIIKAAARDAGAHYIDIENSLAGLELCAGPDAEIGVNGMSWGNDNLLIIGNESYHPNERGHAAIAAAIQQAIPDIINNDQYCNGGGVSWCPSGNKTPPPLSEYYIYEHDPFIKAVYNHSIVKDIIQYPAEVFNAFVSFFDPGSTIYIELRSEPVGLGEFIVDENGEVDVELTIPESVPAGFHELHIIGTLPSGEQIDQYKIILVGHSEDDIDGDGTPNASDQCMFVQPAGIDQDKDGIDDACDPFIDKPKLPGVPTVSATERINNANQSNVVISGEGEEATNVKVAIDDDNEATAAVTAETYTVAAADGKFTYDVVADVSVLDDGPLTVRVVLENEHGEGEPAEAVVQKDTVAPTLKADLSEPANDAGWHKSEVGVTLSAEDGGSGPKQLRYAATGANPTSEILVEGSQFAFELSTEGETTVTYSAIDEFGNESETETINVRIDMSAPLVSVNEKNNPAYVQLLSRNLLGTASDGVSGVSRIEVAFTRVRSHIEKTMQADCSDSCAEWYVAPYTLKTGQYTVVVRAFDRAGNQADATLDDRIIVVSLPVWLMSRR